MIRPWYRSRLFWLGALVVLFLLWAWWDSTRCETQIYLCSDALQFVHARGEIWALWYEDLRDEDGWYPHIERNWPDGDAYTSWEPWLEAEEYGAEIHVVRHRSLVLGAVILLSAFVMLWQRGRNRRSTLHDPR